MSAAEHLAEAIDVGCTRDDHDHIADHRAEVLREAADYFDQFPTNTARVLRAMADQAAKGGAR